MNIQITEIKCNSCSAAIPQANANGAVRLNGTTIDFCPDCAEKAVSFLATTFTMPTPSATGMKKVKLATGQTVMMPAAAPLPQGAAVVGT